MKKGLLVVAFGFFFGLSFHLSVTKIFYCTQNVKRNGKRLNGEKGKRIRESKEKIKKAG